MEREKYAETSSKAIENILKLNKKSWKLYVPLHKKQQLQEQSACCIGIQVKTREKISFLPKPEFTFEEIFIQALLSALGINFEVTEEGSYWQIFQNTTTRYSY